jgi:hypothetical protein
MRTIVSTDTEGFHEDNTMVCPVADEVRVVRCSTCVFRPGNDPPHDR